MAEEPKVTRSSGNIFKGLGLPNANVLVHKAELIRKIYIAIKFRQLTLQQAATAAGVTITRLREILHGHLSIVKVNELRAMVRKLDA